MSLRKIYLSSYLSGLFFLASILFAHCSPALAQAPEEESSKAPFDFLMDVLKPIGMPLVTSYHTMRENIFFNMRVHESNALEALGNFFLSPSQFLFAGKYVSINQSPPFPFELSQCFNYDRLYWLKTLLSLIALPIAEPLGTCIKGLAYLSSEVRLRHQYIEQTLRQPYIQSHLEEYVQKGLSELHSETFIPSQSYSRPSHLTKKQKIELEAFRDVISLLDTHNILYWVDCGTCLGAYRYGGIIPWDIDIDIAIFQDDHENVKRLLSTLDPEKYQIQDWSSYSKPKTFLKLYIKETKNLIDIYHYQFDKDAQTISYLYSYEDSPFPDSWKKGERKCTKPLRFDQVFPLKKARFDNLIVWAPHNVVEFLQTKYGQNLDPSMLWDENFKAYIKVSDHPYWKD